MHWILFNGFPHTDTYSGPGIPKPGIKAGESAQVTKEIYDVLIKDYAKLGPSGTPAFAKGSEPEKKA